MAEIIKEVTTTQTQPDNFTTRVVPVAVSSEEPEATTFQTGEYLIYFFFGALEILLAFRFILKLTGANFASGFVEFIYNLSSIFVLPFEGIFRIGVAQSSLATAVFEPASLVAIMVYAVLAWGAVQLLHVLSGKKQVTN
jgi:hypothetical protein